jgi:hypothetical protein
VIESRPPQLHYSDATPFDYQPPSFRDPVEEDLEYFDRCRRCRMLPEVFKLLHQQVGRAKNTQELLDLQESAYVRNVRTRLNQWDLGDWL